MTELKKVGNGDMIIAKDEEENKISEFCNCRRQNRSASQNFSNCPRRRYLGEDRGRTP